MVLIHWRTDLSITAFGWTLLALVIQRFYGICHPLTDVRWKTKGRTKRILVAIWGISLLLSNLAAIQSDVQPYGTQGNDRHPFWMLVASGQR